MFLAHFVGDVHQPLHCGHAEDLGGNTIIVHWYRRKSNLHHVRIRYLLDELTESMNSINPLLSVYLF